MSLETVDSTEVPPSGLYLQKKSEELRERIKAFLSVLRPEVPVNYLPYPKDPDWCIRFFDKKLLMKAYHKKNKNNKLAKQVRRFIKAATARKAILYQNKLI